MQMHMRPALCLQAPWRGCYRLGTRSWPWTIARIALVARRLPDKLDWVQHTLLRSPEHRLKLTGSRTGQVKLSQLQNSSVPVIGPSAIFMPEHSVLGSAASMHALERSRSGRDLHKRGFVNPPSSVATGASRPRPGTIQTEERWSMHSFDRIAAHFAT